MTKKYANRRQNYFNVVIDSNIKEFNRLYKDKNNGRSQKEITCMKQDDDDKVMRQNVDDNNNNQTLSPTPSPHPPQIYIESDLATQNNQHLKVLTPNNRGKKSQTHKNNEVTTPRSMNKL